MAIDPRIRTLLEGLADATASRKLGWEKTGDVDTFAVELRRNRLELKRGFDLNRDPYFDLVIKDPFERIVETVMIDTGEDLDLASDLYFAARRRALGLDPVLDNMLEDIEAIRS